MQNTERDAGHQVSHFTVGDNNYLSIGDKYYEAPKPAQLVPRTNKCGLCLGGSPKIEDVQFHGRRADLEEMQTYLEAESKSTSPRCLVLGGVGGIGKTQLALKYAECHQDLYDSVFWLNASSGATLNLSFREIAEDVFQGQDFDSFEDKQIQIAIRQWLSDQNNGRWLLVCDNYDEPNAYDIKTYYPRGGFGSIIVTTRSPEQVNGHRIRVCPLIDVEDSLAILETRSGRKDVNTDKHARALANRMAGLPLALATAGAYLKRSPWTFQEYLDEYEKRWDVNPRMAPELPEYKDRTLYTTWDISYARLQKQQPQAAQLLALLAYFDNQKLWYGHFKAGASDDLPEWLQVISSDQVQFENLMNILVSQCFIEVQVATQSYSIHAAVHDWTLAALNQDIEPSFYWYAFNCVRASIVKDDLNFFNHISYSTVTEHAKRLTHNRFAKAEVLNIRLEVCYEDAFWVAELLRAQIVLRPAEQMYLRALTGFEKALGRDHTSTLVIVCGLGFLYTDQDMIEKAEEMHTRALAGFEKAFGRDHNWTLTSVCNLGNIYAAQGMSEKAEATYTRAWAGFEKALGPFHTSTLHAVNGLGHLYLIQNKLEEAEEMLTRALAGYEKALGPDHIQTLETINNLGVLYLDQGKLKEAKEMFLRAATGNETALGPDHPSTVRSRRNLERLGDR